MKTDLLDRARWILSALFLIGTSPTFFILWVVLRIITWIPPLSHQPGLYEHLDDILYSLYQKLVVFFFETSISTQLILYGDVDEITRVKENAILISNHQSTFDWVIADLLAVRQGSIGHIRYVLKDSLKYIPLYGFYFKQHSCIYVKRSGRFQQQHAEGQLDQLRDSNIPFWMVVFPEGTRHNPNLPDVIAKARAFSEQHGLPVYEEMLTPRPKALHLCIEKLRPNMRALYDATVTYSDTLQTTGGRRCWAPQLIEFLKKRHRTLHIRLKRIPIEDIPSDKEQFEKWLHERFVIKDRLLKNYYTPASRDFGTLGSDGRPSPLPLSTTLPVFLFWCCVNLPLWLTLPGIFIYAVILIQALIVSLVWVLFQP